MADGRMRDAMISIVGLGKVTRERKKRNKELERYINRNKECCFGMRKGVFFSSKATNSVAHIYVYACVWLMIRGGAQPCRCVPLYISISRGQWVTSFCVCIRAPCCRHRSVRIKMHLDIGRMLSLLCVRF